ncbi:MAG: hypothetical protein KF716_32125 [Anaerolineae bacterium]|nr:hypothetical protein [Anaerolineae bacterium]
MATVEKVSYGGWSNVYRVANQQIELMVTADVGPRIIRFGFVGGDNVFYQDKAVEGKLGGDDWQLYGGHRLWHAPEDAVRTYYPDNQPLTITTSANGLKVVQAVEPPTGIQKEIEITISESNSVRVLHRLRNHNQWSVELAPWALSVMAGGGVGIVPQPPKGVHPRDLVPAARIIVWPFTYMADPRWTWGNNYIMLRQDNNSTASQKFGMSITENWMAYARNGNLFVKTFKHQAGATYPDLGCSGEMFTNDYMLEVESLGPVANIAPGAAVEHEEHWYLFNNVPMPATEADVDQHVLPAIKQIK